jgi:hypothetical protein
LRRNRARSFDSGGGVHEKNRPTDSVSLLNNQPSAAAAALSHPVGGDGRRKVSSGRDRSGQIARKVWRTRHRGFCSLRGSGESSAIDNAAVQACAYASYLSSPSSRCSRVCVQTWQNLEFRMQSGTISPTHRCAVILPPEF